VLFTETISTAEAPSNAARVPEARAAALVHAAGSGTTLALIATPPEQRDPGLSATAYEAVIAAISTDQPVGAEPGPMTAAVALHAALPTIDGLTPAEKTLLSEWLDRITS
jgi:N12 class adenine-specific DNA methylase